MICGRAVEEEQKVHIEFKIKLSNVDHDDVVFRCCYGAENMESSRKIKKQQTMCNSSNHSKVPDNPESSS
jgi:hypothetical protein